ncbi:Serine 3-dehydrogenase [Candidatus Rhabdochlamydia oedothoracis]|uniref:Serine 3-dehydrogenase n=1 Tax=Candidatus Rhabdochlamydia oedothoracis TaxID=2720720 RepID=A0ABX8V1L8_9BACT|nr:MULTISPECIES: SDR family NAD(P)-dependent oxidoreductase [Rhabdochlamydia]KAG6559314.1 Serine 3-dehydrogenase [Candidatus Rhabdochlamydia sp. W815]MCL6755970.1 SDR family NAD(P)-dependent oxidoreductase [Candidatus Rhabdochlamydia oedothoracis]QYF49142.1 Serine 3-dehydrogenase [Candidatus Rhabdochlamydia oedothoracis]
MNYDLALVTGATSGLGRALCYALAQRNISLIAVGRNIQKLQLLAKKIQTPIRIVQADLSQLNQRTSLYALIQELCPDLVINNAGFGLYGSAIKLPLKLLQEMIQVNIQAVMECSIEATSALKKAKKPGLILNISSAAAFFSYPNFSVYAASKAFVYRFSEALDIELSAYHIRVLTICPGQIATDFRKKASQNFPQKPDYFTLSCEKAVRLIIKQISQKKRVKIIDLRYRLMIFLTYFIPKSFLLPLLQRSLSKRYRKNS